MEQTVVEKLCGILGTGHATKMGRQIGNNLVGFAGEDPGLGQKRPTGARKNGLLVYPRVYHLTFGSGEP